MNRHVAVSLTLTDYADDGEAVVRQLKSECYGGFNRDAWTTTRMTGMPMTEEELALVSQIHQAVAQLAEMPKPKPGSVGSILMKKAKQRSHCSCGMEITQDSCPKCGTWHDLEGRR